MNDIDVPDAGIISIVDGNCNSNSNSNSNSNNKAK